MVAKHQVGQVRACFGLPTRSGNTHLSGRTDKAVLDYTDTYAVQSREVVDDPDRSGVRLVRNGASSPDRKNFVP